ncbi:MAG: VanW family protein [Chloroflexota bacterium]
MRQPLDSGGTERERRPELIRSATGRRSFGERQAQRRLQKKESRWTILAYAVAVGVTAIILVFAYSSYAFSKYRGVILPGVRVDQVKLGGLTEKQAADRLNAKFLAVHKQPVSLVYGSHTWTPQESDYGLGYEFTATAHSAMNVGRKGKFWQQWIDRLPFGITHSVPIIYTLDERQLKDYIMSIGGGPRGLSQPPINAALKMDSVRGYRAMVLRSKPGTRLDESAAVQQVVAALGGLSTQTVHLQVRYVRPAITNTDAHRVAGAVNRFLRRAPVIALGKRVVVTNQSVFGPMISFQDQTARTHPAIQVNFDYDKLRSFVASLAAQVDRPSQEAKLAFNAGQVQVITRQHSGRTLDQTSALHALLPVLQGLKPGARLHFHITINPPAFDQSNPASFGITTLLGFGESSFQNAGPTRLQDVQAVAKSLNQTLLDPGRDISFNTLVSTNWPNRMYNDHLQDLNGQLVPGDGGAIQQVATAFLRALYSSGLTLEERHAHVNRLPFYEPPIGLDAVVAPGRNWDLRFANSTGKTLLVETVVQPLRQELYIYVYGPKLGWTVKVHSRVKKVYPHGPQIERQDPSLSPGEVQQIAWPLDGADVVTQRSITHHGGTVTHDSLVTHYRPSEAIITVGNQPATPTPTAGKKHKKSGTATPTPSPSPSAQASPSPSPTLSH